MCEPHDEVCGVSEEELREIYELIAPLLADESIWGNKVNFAYARIGLYGKLSVLKCRKEVRRRAVFELITRWQVLRRERDKSHGNDSIDEDDSESQTE